jgi:DNA-binding response OmpR family regulator
VNLLRLTALVSMAPRTSVTVLLVEDHLLTRRFLADNLSADGYLPLEASSVEQARRLILGGSPTLVILDLELPDGDGLDLISELRDPDVGLGRHLPVLVLSGRGTEIDRVRGLNRGADDYLVKPYGYGEVRARIEALLRRSTRRPGAERMRIGGLELDPQSRQVSLNGLPVALSKKEFSLLSMLAAAPTRTFTRDELLREVWGFQSPGRTRTLDTHAHRLRGKLATGSVPFVVNVWGVGYRLCDSEGVG